MTPLDARDPEFYAAACIVETVEPVLPILVKVEQFVNVLICFRPASPTHVHRVRLGGERRLVSRFSRVAVFNYGGAGH